MARAILAGGGNSIDTDVINASSSAITAGTTCIDKEGNKITGDISELTTTDYYPSASTQSISSGKYITNSLVLQKVNFTNFAASNIRHGATLNVGYTGNNTGITSIAGTFTNDANAAASDMLANTTGFVKGAAVVGTIVSKGATSYGPTNSAITISAKQYLSGAQTINKLTGTANTAHVCNTVTFSSTAGAGLTGGIKKYSGTTSWTPRASAAQTVQLSGLWSASNVTVNAISNTNLKPEYIKKGVVITVNGVNTTGTYEGWS